MSTNPAMAGHCNTSPSRDQSEGCSCRLALVQIKKAYPGHARWVTMGVWSHLRQFMYTKFVVGDDDVNVRDTMLVANALIDYLDFASPVSGLRSEMGLDATNVDPQTTAGFEAIHA